MPVLDTCVVGAGAAGLVAARELSRAGLSVRVLEARDRVGGRGWTDIATFGVPIDRGCAWLHNAPGNPWTQYAQAQGFTVVERSPEWQRYVGRTPLSAERRARWHAAWERAEQAIESAARAGRDVPASSVVPPDLEFRTLFDATMSWAMGVDTDALSTMDYARYDDADVFPRTIDVLVARLRQKLEIDSKRPAIIRTVRGEGYRFDPPVRWELE